jgi:hypothetical protein
MSVDKKAISAAKQAFSSEGQAITLGTVVHDGSCNPELIVVIALNMMNRRGALYYC